MFFGSRKSAVFRPPHGTIDRPAFSEHRFQASTTLRASALVRVKGDPLDASAGPRLIVTGVVSLRAPHGLVVFRQGSHGELDESAEPLRFDTPLFPPGTVLSLPGWQIPGRGGRSANLWVSFVDGRGSQLAAPVCVGRPSAQSLHVDPLFEVRAVVTLWLKAGGFSRQGPMLELNGEVALPDGVRARLSMSEDSNRLSQRSQPASTFEVEAASPGTRIEVPSRTLSALLPGEPFVSVALKRWDGQSSGGEMPVGWLVAFS